MKAIITFTSGLESSASEKTMSLSVRLGHDGDKGGTPVLEPGTTTTLDAGINATAEIVLKGVDTEGNPKYKVNFGIPKGAKGDMPTPVQAVSSSTTDVPSCKAVTDYLGGKVDKESGKALSSNDFSTSYKDKLDGLRGVIYKQVSDISEINGLSSGVYLLDFNNVQGQEAILFVTSYAGGVQQMMFTTFGLTNGKIDTSKATDNLNIYDRYGPDSDSLDLWTDYLGGKVDKESGKTLSSNDFTNDLKNKLTNLVGVIPITSKYGNLDSLIESGVYLHTTTLLSSASQTCLINVIKEATFITQCILCNWGLSSGAINTADIANTRFIIRRGTIENDIITWGAWQENGAETLISQTITEDIYKAPSCKAVKTALASKLGTSQIVQAVSSSTTDVPSCKAVADAKELLFRDMWNSGCGSYGKFNTATGYYELNGLTNITYTQALRIYNIWERKLTEGCYLYENIRTNMPVWNGGYASIGYGSCYLSFAYNTVLEKAMVSPALYYINSITNASLMFNNCQNLDEIIGNLICPSFPSTFSKCYKLRKLYVKSLKSDISFSDSPLLNYDSVKYMVDNAANTTAIVITVHATTLGYLNGTASDYTSTGHTKEEWQAIVTSATTKNITFATA